MRLIFLVLTALLTLIQAGAQDLKPFEFVPDTQQATEPTPAKCEFANLTLPKDTVVLAAGGYTGRRIAFQIDQSGHEATQVDVAVNYPAQPVALVLAAYEPTIWNIGWSKDTRIVAVFTSGYHRQAVAGLNKGVPTLTSTFSNKGPCGWFYIKQNGLEAVNPTARQLFGRPAQMVYLVQDGKVLVGDLLAPGTELVTSSATPPESLHDRNAPMAGPAGLEDAVQKGLLRRATQADAQAWANERAAQLPAQDVPPIAGGSPARPRTLPMFRAYVVLKPFTYPAGLFGGNSATFFIPKGVPLPNGNPGHSAVFDFNTMSCIGAMCRAIGQQE